MIGKSHNIVDNFISPVIQRAPAAPEEDRELEKSEKLKEIEVVPVPDGQEEVRQPKVGRRPMAPTKAEVEEHYPLHLNYRSWCEHCRAGKSRQDPHLVEPHDRSRSARTMHLQRQRRQKQ